ncbi:GroES-like protein [Mytilinidion resinicola]|uniref:GroES-like protein n=1 Tax=Mytilinidion resinicola TaxID=574789 RepID=A0A6A6YT89_9PEZI|nr:GroES-like protein [Mytilinidion resinicola]KAF2811583.1 GroES-like protein [Mytilinidion resinicola]
MTSPLPPHHRALVLSTRSSGFSLHTVPIPLPTPGSAVLRILQAGIISYHREVYDGTRPYSFPTPLVGGSSAIGRVAALGPDAVSLTVGQLVFVDCVVRGRDDPRELFLTAISEGARAGSKKLFRDVWRDGVWAEYARMPLENCVPLDEERLCAGLGYEIKDLMYMCHLLVPYGGLRDIRVEPGETVVVAPATGGYGGAGVQVAVALGARVIAMGRDEGKLAALREHVKMGTPGASIETVRISGDEKTDTAALQAFGTIDAVLDFTPPAASKSTHLKSAVAALRRGGRVSMMGFVDVPASSWKLVGDNITLKGKLMYEREDMFQFVKMLERGLFPKGEEFVDAKTFPLEDWKEAMDSAAEYTGIGKLVSFAP